MPKPKKVSKPVKTETPVNYYELAREDTRRWAEARKREIFRLARLQTVCGDDPRGILEVMMRKVGELRSEMGGEAWRLWNLRTLQAQDAVDAGVDLKKVVESFVGSPERDRRESELTILFTAAKLKAGTDLAKRIAAYNAALNDLCKEDQGLFFRVWQRDIEASKNT